MATRKPKRWQSSDKAVKAVQVAFDVDDRIQAKVRMEAAERGITPSDRLRELLELGSPSRPKRPRLTLSLTPQDYQKLGQRYDVAPEDTLEIKRLAIETLIKYVNSAEPES